MGAKIWLINGILGVAVVFFGIRVFEVWDNGVEFSPQSQRVDSEPPPRTMTSKEIIARPVLPESAYEAVVSNNLFSPEREASSGSDSGGDDGEDWADSAEGKDLLGVLKEMVLHGVVITEESKAALVTVPVVAQETPGSPYIQMLSPEKRALFADRSRNLPLRPKDVGGKRGGGEKRDTIWVRTGDSLKMFVVGDILPDRVVLSAGGREFDLLIYDKDKPKRQYLPKKAAEDVVVKETVEKESVAKEAASSLKKGAEEAGKNVQSQPSRSTEEARKAAELFRKRMLDIQNRQPVQTR